MKITLEFHSLSLKTESIGNISRSYGLLNLTMIKRNLESKVKPRE